MVADRHDRLVVDSCQEVREALELPIGELFERVDSSPSPFRLHGHEGTFPPGVQRDRRLSSRAATPTSASASYAAEACMMALRNEKRSSSGGSCSDSRLALSESQ